MVDKDSDFKDGWGDAFDYSISTNDLSIEYLGTTKPTEYSSDTAKNIMTSDWSVDFSKLDISVENKTEAEIPTPIIIALSVFKNIQIDLSDVDKSNDSVWQTYHYTVADSPLLIGGIENSILGGALWKSEDNADATAIRIPAGEHIVFVGVDGDTTTCASPNTPNQKIESCEIKDQHILKVIPRYTQIPVPLVIE